MIVQIEPGTATVSVCYVEHLIQKILDKFWMAIWKAHEDCSCSLQRKVGKSWELLTYSIQGRHWVLHVMYLENFKTGFTNVNL